MKKRSFLILLLLALVLPGASSLIARPERPASRAIARIWRGRTLASKADEYQAYLDASGVSKVRATPGNLGVTVLRRNDGGKTEFLVLSLWESVDAIKKFAGEDYQKAVILPRDREYLLEVEPNVLHYEILREDRKK
jgi:heme-degrading monooxygenase HmoA